MLISLLFAATLAHADTPVLHDRSPDDAVQRAVTYGAGAPWDLDPMRPDRLLPSTQAGLVGIEPACQRAVATGPQLAKSIELASLLFQRKAWERAEVQLRQARSELSCLVDEVNAAQIAQLHLMAGIVAHEQGDTDATLVAFDRAHRFGSDPTTGGSLIWNGRLASPAHGGEAFDAAARALAAAETGTLRIAPGVDPGRLDVRIDGRSVPLAATDALELPVGYHHIQVVAGGPRGRVVRTFEVELDTENPIVVADPQGLSELRLAPYVGSPAMADFIRAAGFTGRTWVITDTDVWTLDQDWTRVPDPVALDPQTLRDRATRRRAVGISTLLSGAIVTGMGAWGRATSVTAKPWEERAEQVEYRQTQARVWGAVALTGLGGMTAGTTLLVLTPRPR